MQTQSQVPAKHKSNTLWLLIGTLILACCVVVIAGVVLAGPLIRTAFNGISNSLQGINLSTTASPSNTTSPSETSSPSSGPAAGGLGDSQLKSDVWASILNFYAANQSCTDVTNTQIEVTQQPTSNGVWKEAWSVDACGQTAVLNVRFTPSPKGGTDFNITQQTP